MYIAQKNIKWKIINLFVLLKSKDKIIVFIYIYLYTSFSI